MLVGSDPSVPHVIESHNIKTYTASDLCWGPANGARFIDPGYIHDVLLTDLKPSTTYYYSCGSVKVTADCRGVAMYNIPPTVRREVKFSRLEIAT